jgi:hypothetical protein
MAKKTKEIEKEREIDVTLKDEGEFLTVICKTKNAKERIASQVPENLLRTTENFQSFDVDVTQQRQMEILFVSHDLAWDTF